MANDDFNDDFNKGRRKAHSRKKSRMSRGAAPMPEKTPNWPGLPGKKQTRDRSGGTKKLKIYPSSEGL